MEYDTSFYIATDLYINTYSIEELQKKYQIIIVVTNLPRSTSYLNIWYKPGFRINLYVISTITKSTLLRKIRSPRYLSHDEAIVKSSNTPSYKI